MKNRYKLLVITTLLLLCGCMPNIYPPGTKAQLAQLREHEFVTEDGTILPIQHWLPEQPPKAVIIALHGFNDYSHFFEKPAIYFQQHRIASYAYDQRGFGRSPNHGLWAGTQAYVDDLAIFTNLIAQKHPRIPIYLLGESMGAAVIIVAAAENKLATVDGIILSAPAIWSRDTMPWYQRWLLWTLSHTLPWLTLTGESAHVVASDNTEMLRALGRDPLVIKATRVEALHGLVDLMDTAMAGANQVNLPTLLMYGAKDQIIPPQPTHQFIKVFLSHQAEKKIIACYENGYHLLLRDLQAAVLWQDLVNWTTVSRETLVSGAQKNQSCKLID